METVRLSKRRLIKISFVKSQLKTKTWKERIKCVSYGKQYLNNDIQELRTTEVKFVVHLCCSTQRAKASRHLILSFNSFGEIDFAGEIDFSQDKGEESPALFSRFLLILQLR